jgi:hypothetical protein
MTVKASQRIQPRLAFAVGFAVAIGIGIGIGIGAGIWKSPTPSTTSASATTAEWLFVVPARSANLTLLSTLNTTFVATLEGVINRSLAFTNHPLRDSALVWTPTLMNGLNNSGNDTYNAALSFYYGNYSIAIPVDMLSVSPGAVDGEYVLNLKVLEAGPTQGDLGPYLATPLLSWTGSLQDQFMNDIKQGLYILDMFLFVDYPTAVNDQITNAVR